MGAPSLLPVILVFAGLVGLAIGSFLNVVIYRVPAGIALTRPSRCPSCAASVRPWQNVPVVSWIALRGRCASCGGAISPRYPMVEAATALAFVVLAWMLTDGGGVGIGIGQHAAGTGIPPASAVPLGVAFLYFAAISIASDLRYHLWAMIATALALVLLGRAPWRRRWRTLLALVLAAVIGVGGVARAVLPPPPQDYAEWMA